jgi:hypothetical protein
MVLMKDCGALEFSGDRITIRSDFGVFDVPRDVYARAVRLDRRYPNNYSGGYLGAWCRHQWSEKR